MYEGDRVPASPSPRSEPRGLSLIAEELKALDKVRRAAGLNPQEARRYHSLFAQFSDVLAGGERKRRMDARQFLRIPFPMQVMLCAGSGERSALCHDFGGGGLAMTYGETLQVGDALALDCALVGGQRYGLPVRAEVVWVRPVAYGAACEHGLRFVFDSPEARDHVDRLFYSLLGLFLEAQPS